MIAIRIPVSNPIACRISRREPTTYSLISESRAVNASSRMRRSEVDASCEMAARNTSSDLEHGSGINRLLKHEFMVRGGEKGVDYILGQ